ncbi:MAG: hypothetical protein ACFFCQ_18105, partial [Promethearchaeota archaeon]
MRTATNPFQVIDRWYLSVRRNLLRYMSCETMIRGTWSIVRIAGWPLYKFFIRADVKGQENLPSDPVVIAPRHSNAWDAPLSA